MYNSRGNCYCKLFYMKKKNKNLVRLSTIQIGVNIVGIPIYKTFLISNNESKVKGNLQIKNAVHI